MKYGCYITFTNCTKGGGPAWVGGTKQTIGDFIIIPVVGDLTHNEFPGTELSYYTQL